MTHVSERRTPKHHSVTDKPRSGTHVTKVQEIGSDHWIIQGDGRNNSKSNYIDYESRDVVNTKIHEYGPAHGPPWSRK